VRQRVNQPVPGRREPGVRVDLFGGDREPAPVVVSVGVAVGLPQLRWPDLSLPRGGLWRRADPAFDRGSTLARPQRSHHQTWRIVIAGDPSGGSRHLVPMEQFGEFGVGNDGSVKKHGGHRVNRSAHVRVTQDP
jgi:hypothetical protein